MATFQLENNSQPHKTARSRILMHMVSITHARYYSELKNKDKYVI